MAWFHEAEVLPVKPTSELEFDLELERRNSRVPTFSLLVGSNLQNPRESSCLLGGGDLGGYERQFCGHLRAARQESHHFETENIN